MLDKEIRKHILNIENKIKFVKNIYMLEFGHIEIQYEYLLN